MAVLTITTGNGLGCGPSSNMSAAERKDYELPRRTELVGKPTGMQISSGLKSGDP